MLLLGADNPSAQLAVLDSVPKTVCIKNASRNRFIHKGRKPKWSSIFTQVLWSLVYMFSLNYPQTRKWRQAKGEGRNQRTEDLNTHSPRMACVESKECGWWRFRGLRCLKSVILFYVVNHHRLCCASDSIVLGWSATSWQALEYDSAGWPQHRQ